VLQDRIAEQHPWLPMALFEAFERSKQLAQAGMPGQDPYPCGLRAMRHTLERLERASYEQGLIRNRIPIDSLYHPSTLST
jgi:4,5-dihydroxyphthalate decarboxylase